MPDDASDAQEWLFCAKCYWDFGTPAQMRDAGTTATSDKLDRRLYVTSCGHIYCSKCLGASTGVETASCLECNAPVQCFALFDHLSPEFRPFFEPADKAFETAIDIYHFQQERMVHWVRQMKKKLVSQKGLLDRAKDALAQKQKLEEENERLKKELAAYNTGTATENRDPILIQRPVSGLSAGLPPMMQPQQRTRYTSPFRSQRTAPPIQPLHQARPSTSQSSRYFQPRANYHHQNPYYEQHQFASSPRRYNSKRERSNYEAQSPRHQPIQRSPRPKTPALRPNPFRPRPMSANFLNYGVSRRH